MGLKTTYYLRTMGASRIEKSTVNLAKFGGTSKGDNAVSNNQPIASTVIIEETIAVLPRQSHEEPSMEFKAPISNQSVPSPIIIKEPVVSKGVPMFGEASTAVTNRPKIEIIGEACESCTA
jgi:hypothetical protein